jgi:hypothetical protein
MEADECEHCGTDLNDTIPHVGLLSRCRHCRQLLAQPRRGLIAPRGLPFKEQPVRPSSKLATTACIACGEVVLVVQPVDVGRTINLELHALDNLGELTALMSKRKTFDLCSDGTADLRDAWDITARPAEKHGITHTQHVCLKLLGSIQRFTVEGDHAFADEPSF